MNADVRVVEDVAGAFGELVSEEIEATAEPRFTLALSGGSTATQCYRALAQQPVRWPAVTLVWGDDRCVPMDHEDSNYLLAKNALLDHIEKPEAVVPMQCGSVDAYDQTINRISPIDLVHLGMGDDGHTASLFPDSPALQEKERMVVETGDDLHPHRRMTLTYPAIDAARLAVFTVTGAAKAEMLARVLAGENFPAAHVRTQRIIWLVDPAAAAQLD